VLKPLTLSMIGPIFFWPKHVDRQRGRTTLWLQTLLSTANRQSMAANRHSNGTVPQAGNLMGSAAIKMVGTAVAGGPRCRQRCVEAKFATKSPRRRGGGRSFDSTGVHATARFIFVFKALQMCRESQEYGNPLNYVASRA
jgi:hypothetical protein